MKNKYEIVDVLLVEDNRNDAELTIRTLRKHNLAPFLFHVRDGAEAIEFLFAQGRYADRSIQQLPKLILLDLKLPKLDGLEVLRQIRLHEATRCIPVVILTSSREETDIVESYHLGVNSYVVKPVTFKDFAEAIHELGTYWMIMNQTPY